ncbi:MAG: argininosuccinate lyase [Dehalococcoidia bacterium]|nr:argininosuccinate lyase [Dehalococcoidia bacterium]
MANKEQGPARKAGRGKKPWSGRFAAKTHPLVDIYTSSLGVDSALYRQDIRASIAHARMLARQRIIPRADADAIVRGLREIEREIEKGEFPFDESLEDIHTNIEARLKEKIGGAADRLHTARSRNDQVATDLRLFLKERVAEIMGAIRVLQMTIIKVGERHIDAVMPGYTHLQRAQPVLFAHHLLAYFEMLERDLERFGDCFSRADVLPLGSGALAGVPYPIDRGAVASELGFADISRNSIDAVSDRDFALEFLFDAAVCMMHLSRLAEEIVLWSSAEFGFIELDDAFATGSSIMPQKKNPDVAELARARTGRVYGRLAGLLATLKGLPLSYNRDLQEDKEPLLDAHQAVVSTLIVFAPLLQTMRVNEERMRAAAAGGYALATDLADYLARKGVPFRQAHEAVGKLVKYAQRKGKELSELTLAEYRRFSPLFDEDALRLDLEASLKSRDIPGGTAPRQVRQALREERERLQKELEER